MNNPHASKLLKSANPTPVEQLSAYAEAVAKVWLCRDPRTTFPPSDFATCRAEGQVAAGVKFGATVEASELQRVWQSVFDYTVRETTAVENPIITRAEILEDIWSTGGLDEEPGYLARKGDIVNVQPAPFVQCPVTVMPRRGTIFCTTPEKVRELETVSLAGFIEPFPEHQE